MATLRKYWWVAALGALALWLALRKKAAPILIYGPPLPDNYDPLAGLSEATKPDVLSCRDIGRNAAGATITVCG